jgi:hypothetical protein
MPDNVVRTYFKEQRTGPLFSRGTARGGDVTRDIMRATANDIATAFIKAAGEDIKGAGKFGSRWTDGFTANVTQGGGNIRLDIDHQVPYFSTFTKTTTIQGKPMLWIPLSFAADAIGKRARDYGPLFRVDRRGGKAPLLFSFGQKPAEPKYFGKSSVTIPQKFHTFEIARAVAARAGEFFKTRLGKVK